MTKLLDHLPGLPILRDPPGKRSRRPEESELYANIEQWPSDGGLYEYAWAVYLTIEKQGEARRVELTLEQAEPWLQQQLDLVLRAKAAREEQAKKVKVKEEGHVEGEGNGGGGNGRGPGDPGAAGGTERCLDAGEEHGDHPGVSEGEDRAASDR